MKKNTTYRLLGFVIVCMLLFQSQVSVAQWTADVLGAVKKEEDKKRMAGATITIKRNGVVWKTITADARGRFEMPLLPGAIYIIEVSKPMHVTKRIEISTKNVPPDDAKFGFEIPFEVNLFEKMEGLDVSILNKPIAKIAFDPNFGTMEFDAAYTKSIKVELDRLKRELAARLKGEEENRKKNQKVYDAAIAAGDKAFNAGNLEAAIPFYTNAAKIFPKETYPEFQLGDISDKLKEKREADKRYKSTIVKADAAFKAREWEKATSAYEHAAYLKESEQYPKDKVKEIKDIVSKEKKVEKEYNELIAAADQSLLSKEYDKAKTDYTKAAALKSYEQYPKDKLKEIELALAEIAKKAAEEKAKEAKYKALIAAADKMLGTKNYDGAKGKYNAALGVKSAEQYPKDKLLELEGLIAEAAKKEAERKAKEAAYKALIASADNLLSSKDYTGAKGKYNEALGIKKDEQYPKDKLKAIAGILAEIAKKAEEERLAKEKAAAEKKAKEEAYNKLIASADGMLGSKNYEGAKGKYNEALGVKSAEQYPKDKLKEIDGILAEIAKKAEEERLAKEKEAAEKKAKEEAYNKLIASADGMLGSKNYEGAKGKYNEALGIKSAEQYPKGKIKEIDGILAEIARKAEEERLAKEKAAAEKKAKEEAYKALIASADNLLGSKNYEGAKGKYNEALGIKAAEQYPKGKIKEIDGLLAELAKKEAAAKAKEAKYQGLIVAADKMLGSKDYTGAKGKYNEALGVKSTEQYPKDKIKEIGNILAEIARKKAEADAANLAAGERDAKYAKTITLADAAFGSKKYETAKSKYNEALGIKSGEQYPKDKLKEIELALAALAKKKAEDAANLAAGEREAQYQTLITAADKLMGSKSYAGAKGKYNDALGIKTAEQYPKDKLAEIERILAEIAQKKAAADAANLAAGAKEANYKKAIKLADAALSSKDYTTAKGKYNEALGIKSSEQYPKDKLAEIEVALAKLADKNAEDALALESERKKREYFDALVAEADGELVGKNYDAAKSKYNQALGVIPGEQYPKDKLKEITNILAGIKNGEKNDALAKKQLEENYKKLIAQGDAAFSSKNYKGAKPKYTEALSLKNGEAYPRNQLAEIERILAEIAAKESKITLKNNAQKQKEQAYADFIANGDEQLSGKQYRSAISNYKQALEIKSSESYPKEKIQEINKILAALSAKERASSADALAEKEKRKRYDKVIYDADRALRLKDYDKAKRDYNSALSIYVSEQYPKNKLVEIEALLNKTPEEKVIVKNNTGEKSRINDDNEREIEKRMALLMGKSIVEKDKKLDKDKEDYNHQQTIRISGGIERTVAADKELEIYATQERKVVKEQEELSIDKSDAHYVYVDNLEEGDIMMRERGEELRASNRKEIVKVAADSEKSKRKGRKRRKEKELDVIELKSKVAKQEEIRLRASIGRTTKNGDDIKRLSEDMTKMKAEKSEYYKENVIELTAYKEKLNNRETELLDRAADERQVNKKEKDRIYEQDRKDLKKQNKKYYKDAKLVDDYKKEVSKQEVVNREEADQRRVASNEELLKAKGKLGETTVAQKKRYEDFHTKLKEEQELNNNFLADLQLMETDKILLANAALKDFYMGEAQPSINEELASKYSQGITEETVESGNSIVIKRTKVAGKHVDVYERVFYKWGGSYFLKNGKNITQSLWDKESID